MTADTAPASRTAFPSATTLVIWLSIAVSPLGAALAFVLQPMMAKLLLPRLGGTAATWLGAVLFFQIALLLGYAWGVWLARRTPRFQAIALAALALVAFATFHAPESFTGEPTIVGVITALTFACLPAMVLLFSLSPWLQSWRERLELPEPYALYAISNVGSLLALLIYPFAVEPLCGLADQLLVWRGLFCLAASVLIAGAILLCFVENRRPSLAPPVALGRIHPLAWAGWISLGALSCGVMLAATQLVADEIGSVPLAWVGPLGVYLAGFALIFSGRWQPWMTGVSIVGLALSLAAYMTVKGFGSATVDGVRLFILVACCGFACLVGNALLHASRPARGGEWFYLALAAGGALGGLGSLWIVPALFPRPVEFTIGAAILLAAGMYWGARWRHVGSAAACSALTLGPILILGSSQAGGDRLGDGTITQYRDVHGHLMIKTDPASVVLSSATTTHGSQLTSTPESRRQPTLYYTESSAIGRAFQRLQASRPAMRIAVVGLGAGTVATYSRPADNLRFFDIDPKIEAVARNHFTFLGDARGKIAVTVADGRRALADSADDYDLIIIDAFMGDGVPAHLLTREALAVYQARLQARDGLLVVHSTLRYSNIYPFVAATAQTLRLESLQVTTDISEALTNRDWDAQRSSYILIGSPALALQWSDWFPLEEEEGRVKREVSRLTGIVTGPRNIWTDDRTAALDTLDLSRWLSP
jgi:hypothetical protein